MKLELSYDTIIRARAALKLMQDHVGRDETHIREYEKAYVELVNAHAVAVRNEVYGDAT